MLGVVCNYAYLLNEFAIRYDVRNLLELVSDYKSVLIVGCFANYTQSNGPQNFDGQKK